MKLSFVSVILLSILFLHVSANSTNHPAKSENAFQAIIKGVVIDNNSGALMEYVHVVLHTIQDSSFIAGVITNNKGHFLIDGIPEGNYFLKIQSIGYKPHYIKDIKISRGKNIYDIGDVNLSTQNNDLQEVEVVADKKHIEYQIDKKIINPNQDIIASGGTAVDVLENVPSIDVDIEGNVAIRGKSNYKVLIDGKESIYENADALKSIPASSIERIELITNPSANYEADGVSGIINVILKKNTKLGLNGLVDFSTNNRGTLNSNIQMSYKPKKINYYFKLRPASYRWEYYRNYERLIMPNEITEYTSNMNISGYYKNFYSMVGADYSINEKNNLSISAGQGWVDFNKNLKEDETNYNSGPPIKNTTTMLEEQYPSEPEVNLLFEHVFDSSDHKLTFMAHYSHWKGNYARSLSNYNTDFDNTYTADSINYSIFTNAISYKRYYKARVDYTKPLKNNMKFETGFQWTHTQREVEYDHRSAIGTINEVTKDTSKCITSDYNRHISAAYATIAGKILKIEYKIGLRSEYNNRSFYNYETDEKVPYNKLQVFPTIHLSRSFAKDQQLLASFSKRITRPMAHQMYSFPIYLDGNNIERGDLLIKEESADSYEMSYTRKFKKLELFSELHFHDTKNPIGRIWMYDTINNIGVNQLVNYKNEKNGGIELQLKYKQGDWLKINLRGNYYYQIIENDFENIPNIMESGVYSSGLSTDFYIKKNTRIQLNLNYNSGSATAQGRREDSFYNSIGIRHSFFNKSLTVNTGVWNLINTARWKTTQITPEIKNIYEYKVYDPFVFINISYKFNNYQPQKKPKFDESNYNSGQYD